MVKTFVIKELEELHNVTEELAKICINQNFFAFFGQMGAGKTTLIRELCTQLGVQDNVSSPSFALINEYKGIKPVYHMDFYRLKSPQEALDIGLEDYFSQDAWIFIEWPEKIEELLPEECVHVHLELGKGQERMIRIKTA